MKFTDGAWLVRDGLQIHKATEIRFVSREENRLVLTVPTYKILHKGMTLGGVFLTMEITSPMENCFKIRTYHHKGDLSCERSYFELDDMPQELGIKDDEDRITVKSGESELIFSKNDFSMKLIRKGRLITASEGGALAYIEGEGKNYMREQLSLGVGEHVYGLGERFGAFIRNGQSIDIENKDGGTFTEQSYKNIPFYITDNDLGVFVDHTETVSFEVASEHVSKVQFSVEGGVP